jgi:hypothetical protein
MKDSKQKHLAVIMLSAVILFTVNVGIWLAAKYGIIPPIGNVALWTAFAVLNVMSLVWAVGLLGLHPLVLAFAYVAGGFLAFKGVEGIPGMNIAEITTAGATYGAFGSLTVGYFTTKVRLAFFNKRQVPFIFVIAVLLVFDAVLSSEISSADGTVVLHAVVFPFVLAGIIIGLVWSMLSRYGIGDRVDPVHDTVAAEHSDSVNEIEESEEPNTLKIQMPVRIEEEDEVAVDAVAMEEPDFPEISEPPDEETVKPNVALEETEEDFFPLEIDRDDDQMLAPEELKAAVETIDDTDSLDEVPLSLEEFDVNLYASIVDEIDPAGDVMIEDPAMSLARDINEAAAPEEPEEIPFIEEQSPESKPPVTVESGEKKSNPSDDWLNGHLDLLNKLK